jgi:hypothetical protein
MRLGVVVVVVVVEGEEVVVWVPLGFWEVVRVVVLVLGLLWRVGLVGECWEGAARMRSIWDCVFGMCECVVW